MKAAPRIITAINNNSVLTFIKLANKRACKLSYSTGSMITCRNVKRFVADYNLQIETFEDHAQELISKKIGVAEVLLTPQSRVIGDSVSKIGFREKYNLNILGINRKGAYLLQNMAEQKLRFGDAILVQGAWDEIDLLSRETQDFVVVGQPREHAGVAAATGKASYIILRCKVMLTVL